MHLNSSLISGGTNFRINEDRMAELIDENMYFDGSESDEEEETQEDMKSKLSPWSKSFDELRELMVKIPSHNIYKRTVNEGVGEVMGHRRCQIDWQYSMFLEKQENPFDTSFVRGARTTIRYDELMQGIWLCLETMRQNEESHFVIDYKLMYGAYGAPPRIPAKADVLLVVKLRRYKEIGDEDDAPKEDRNKFSIIYKKALEWQKNAKYNFDINRYAQSVLKAHSAIESLEICRLANKDEEESQKKLLTELYIHLMDCYNKLEDWKKTCLMVVELKRLCDVNQNVNILLKHGIALVRFSEFDKGLKLLRKAQAIDPHDESVNNALKSALETRDKYDRETKAMWARAFQTKEATKAVAVVEDNETAEFKKKFQGIIDNMAKKEWESVELAGYTPQEIKIAKDMLTDDSKCKLIIKEDRSGQPIHMLEKKN